MKKNKKFLVKNFKLCFKNTYVFTAEGYELINIYVCQTK